MGEGEFEVEGERMLTLARGSREQQYALLDNLEDYVDSRDWPKLSKSTCLSHCRSFFLHNRAALPTDRFIIRSSRPSCSRKLTVDHLRKIVNALLDKPRDRSMILCAWYGFMGSGELEYVNLHGWPQIREQIEKGVAPIRVDLPLGRKNQDGFYTMLGKHAVEALQEYIKLERGEIREGESIWIGRASPVSRRAYADNWRDLTRKLGFLPRRRGDRKSIRYGFNPHNIRDVAKSLVHRAKEKEHEDIMPGVKLLFDMDCVEFWMGHPAKIDPNKYDQFYEDIEYVQRQYRIAEKYLNILIEGEPRGMHLLRKF